MTHVRSFKRKPSELPLFSTLISGRVAILKNNKKLIRVGSRTIPIASDRYKTWERAALIQLHQQWGLNEPMEQPLEVHYRFYFENRSGEADTSNCIEGPQDCLAKAGVIKNDKQIRKIVAEKFFGEEPRTEIEIYNYEGD